MGTLKNGKKLYNERGITFFHKTERYVNNLNIYNRSKNGTNLWNDLIHIHTKIHELIDTTRNQKSVQNVFVHHCIYYTIYLLIN